MGGMESAEDQEDDQGVGASPPLWTPPPRGRWHELCPSQTAACGLGAHERADALFVCVISCAVWSLSILWTAGSCMCIRDAALSGCLRHAAAHTKITRKATFIENEQQT